MKSRNRFLVVLALLFSVFALFFCPLTFGSFQSTHGPTSTINSSNTALDLTLATFIFLVPTIVLLTVRRVVLEPLPELFGESRSLCVRFCTFRC